MNHLPKLIGSRNHKSDIIDLCMVWFTWFDLFSVSGITDRVYPRTTACFPASTRTTSASTSATAVSRKSKGSTINDLGGWRTNRKWFFFLTKSFWKKIIPRRGLVKKCFSSARPFLIFSWGRGSIRFFFLAEGLENFFSRFLHLPQSLMVVP